MKELAKYLYEIGQLKRLRRSGWWIAGIEDPESVAEHSFRVTLLGYILSQLEGGDPLKTIIMCLFHDVPESRLNDWHRIGQRYANLAEIQRQVFSEQVNRLPHNVSEQLTSLMSEFNTGESLEARLAHDADRLECLIQAREYQAQGYKDVQDWINNCEAALITESAKRIAQECLKVEPKEWWQGLNTTN